MNITDLPQDVSLSIFQHLSFLDIARGVRQTCRLWNQLSYEGCLWRKVVLQQRTLPESSFIKFISSVSNEVESLSFEDTSYLESAYCHKNIVCQRLKEILFHQTCPFVEAHVEIVVVLIAKYPNLRSVACELNISDTTKDCLLPFANLKCLESLRITVDEEFRANRTYQEAAVTEIIKNCSSLVNICLQGFSMSEDLLEFILEQRKNVKSLDLNKCYGFGDCSFLEEKTYVLNELIHLNLSDTSVSDKGLKLISSHAPNLRFLSLLSCQWTTDIGLMHVSHHCPFLTSLLVNIDRYVKANVTNSGLQRVTAVCSQLQKIFINYCSEVNDAGVISIANGCPDLRELLIEGCTALTDTAVTTLAGKCPKLSRLVLSECVQLTAISVNDVVTRCKQLRKLDLRTCHRLAGLDFEELTKPVTAISDTETDNQTETDRIGTDLEHSQVQQQEIDTASTAADLQSVDVKMQNIEKDFDVDMQIKEQDLDVYEDSVKECTAGPSDNLSKLTITNTAKHETLTQSWVDHSHLRMLNLGFCSQIANNSLLQIARHCRDLVDLNLEGCSLVTDEGVDRLVRNCRLLRVLNLSGGSLFKSSALTNQSLTSVSKYSENLEKLKIWKNNTITPEGILKVVEGCPALFSVIVSYGSRTCVTVTSMTSELQAIPYKMFKVRTQSAHLLRLYIYPNKEYSINH